MGEQGGAIRADNLVVIAHIEKHMRMVVRFTGTTAHEFLYAHFYCRYAEVVLVMGDGACGHDVTPFACIGFLTVLEQRILVASTNLPKSGFAMTLAKLDTAELAYIDEGEGPVVVLVHGFASSKEANWIDTGWVKLLVDAGYRVIAFDNRGHGGSTKFHDSAAYSMDAMTSDAVQLMQYLGLERPHLMGYSMGGRICSELAIRKHMDYGRIVIAGSGDALVKGYTHWDAVADALLAPSLADVSDPTGRAFRKFADATGSDRQALAACVAHDRGNLDPADLAGIENPVLVPIGTEDDLAGSGEAFAAMMPNARYLPIPRRDHMRAVGDKIYKQGVLEFLEEEQVHVVPARKVERSDQDY